MERQALHLLKPLKVIQLGPVRRTQLKELPQGAEVLILREAAIGDCIDIAYADERYFALKSELFPVAAGPALAAVGR